MGNKREGLIQPLKPWPQGGGGTVVCDSFAVNGPQMRGPAHRGQREDLMRIMTPRATHIHPHWNITHFQNTSFQKNRPTVGGEPTWFFLGINNLEMPCFFLEYFFLRLLKVTRVSHSMLR